MSRKIFHENWDNTGNEFDPCSLYEWRLNWLEDKVKQHRDRGLFHSDEQYQRWWDEEEKVYQNNSRDAAKTNKFQKKIGIIVPTHYHHSKFIGACLKSCQETGYYVLLAYDNPFYAEGLKIQTRMPSIPTLMLADSIIIKHKTWGSGVGIPHAWNMFYGLRFLQSLGFEYIFNLNGDCMMEKPENFPELIEMLGDADIIACEYFPDRKYCGTMSWLCKTEIAMEIWNNYITDIYKFNIGNAEARMGRHLIQGSYKIVEVENPGDAHFKPYDNKGTWRKVLGLRHLHAEHKVRRTEKMEPVNKEYFDYGPDMVFMNGHERKTIVKYFETGEKKYLEAWWEK